MIGIMNWNDVLANNLANVNTVGFKQTLATFRNVDNLNVNQIDANKGYSNTKLGNLSAGSTLDSTVLDLRQGSLKTTGNPTDLAISGDGFFVVRTPDGDAYTRSGNFIRRNDGTLATMDGYPVIGQKGSPIILKSSDSKSQDIRIDKQGNIEMGKNIIDKIKVVDFKDKKNLQSIGNSLFKSGSNETPGNTKTYEINQGSLEMANANPIETIVNSITGMRTYDSLAKYIESDKEIETKTVTDLGRIKG
jgi:flagellar basal-body rod protein FlgG